MDEISPPEPESTQDYPQEAPEPVAPQPDVPVMPPAPVGPVPPAAPGKPPTDVLFLVLGLLTPMAVTAVYYALTSGFQNTVLAFLPSLLLFVLFVGAIFMIAIGRSKGNVRLRSFGKGVMWAYVTIPLALLLLFGSCLIGGMPF